MSTRGVSPPEGRFEAVAWLLVLAAAAVTRLWDLGARVMSHDESLHSYYSWVLATRGEYHHDPSLHGPLLYHLDALVFRLLGATDATARLMPAALGVGLIALLLPLRRELGHRGALGAALLVLVSPTALMYSRYIRNDVYIAALSLLWAMAILRYLESRRVGWLALLTAAMALSFASKEVSFIQGAIFGGFAFLVAFATRERTAAAAADLAVLMWTLVLPFAAGAWHVALGWPVVDDGSRVALAHAAASIGTLALLSIVVAWVRFARGGGSRSRGGPGLAAWAACAVGFWTVDLALFTGLGGQPRWGVLSGAIGSLGYWVGQQGVARGGQPWFYYLLLAAMYELATVVLALAALILLRRRWHTLDAPRMRAFALFAWWAVTALVAYSLAGERMPWLLLHPLLPLYLLGGWALGQLAGELRGSGHAMREVEIGAIVALAAVLVVSLTGLRPFAGRDVAATAESMRWLVGTVALVAVLLALRRRSRAVPRSRARAAAAAGLVAVALLGTARAAWQASFVNRDLPTELLVYAHGAPGVKSVTRELELLRARAGRDLAIAYAPETSWPFAWYLRDEPRATVVNDRATLAAAQPDVILAAAPSPDWVWSYVAANYVERGYPMLWWPLDTYRTMTPMGALRRLLDPGVRASVRDVLLYRRYPGLTLRAWPLRREVRLYVRRELDALGAELPYALAGVPPQLAPHRDIPELAWRPLAALRLADGATTGAPIAVGATAEGWLVADGRTSRVVRFARGVQNGPPAVLRGASSAAGGSGEVWGLCAVGAERLAFADTWAGALEVVGRDGRTVRRWGRFGPLTEDRPGAPAMYGPRGLLLAPDGSLIVADTGNNRVLRFDGEGRLLGMVGAGVGAARFLEPVGLALDSQGRLLVADAWNHRIQRLTLPDFAPIDSWPVPGWESTDPVDKPFLAVDDRGRVYATDPAAGRVLVFSSSGEILGSLRLAAAAPGGRTRPVGIAFDAVERQLAVADWAAGRVWIFAPPEP